MYVGCELRLEEEHAAGRRGNARLEGDVRAASKSIDDLTRRPGFTNGEERNGRRLGLASTETEAIRTGHGDADLDDNCKATRTACFANRDGDRRLQRRLGMVEKKEKWKKNRGGGRGSEKKRRRRAMVVGWRVRLEVGHGEGENRKRK